MKLSKIFIIICITFIFVATCFAKQKSRSYYETKIQDIKISVKERQTLWQKMIKLFGYKIEK